MDDGMMDELFTTELLMCPNKVNDLNDFNIQSRL